MLCSTYINIWGLEARESSYPEKGLTRLGHHFEFSVSDAYFILETLGPRIHVTENPTRDGRFPLTEPLV